LTQSVGWPTGRAFCFKTPWGGGECKWVGVYIKQEGYEEFWHFLAGLTSEDTIRLTEE